MNKLLFASLVVLLSTDVFAADNVAWGGFYGSVLVGRNSGDVNKRSGSYDYYHTDGSFVNAHVIEGANSSLDGWDGTLKLGFNKQVNDTLIGIELGASIQDGDAYGVAIKKEGALQARLHTACIRM